MRDEVGISREILVDDITGTVHRAYGMCPNMTWVVGRGGSILYKAMWTSAARVEEFLQRMEGYGIPGTVPFTTEQVEMRTPDRDAFQRRLTVNGPRAVEEFRRAGEHWAQRAKEQARSRRTRSG